MVLAAALITAFLVARFGDLPLPGSGTYTVYVQFPRAPGVTQGSPVRMSGVQIGSTGLTSAIDFIVVAVIGGCLLTGGYGSAIGAAIGAVVYAVARNGIVMAGWDPLWFQALLGVLLLTALLTNGVVRRRLKAAPRS